MSVCLCNGHHPAAWLTKEVYMGIKQSEEYRGYRNGEVNWQIQQ